ncbi:hypothetical protein ACH5RR_009497 [Cinchona calisaya]|uniref:Late blight resistance protein R1A-like N-terminal domain-containing protein n=1 Tax=Cinchona calisaya TaxID=153742 RepID=A0ABD3AHQ2_9GENT
MASTALDSLLDELLKRPEDHALHCFSVIEFQQRIRCLRNLVRCAEMLGLESDDKESALGILLCRIKDAVDKFVQEVHEIDQYQAGFVNCNNGVDFLRQAKSFQLEIKQLSVVNLLDLSSKSRNINDELIMGFMDFLLENLVDVLEYCDHVYADQDLEELMESLEEKLTFLKNLIRLAIVRGIEDRELMDNLLTHARNVAVDAAHLSYLCWIDRYDERKINAMEFRIFELLERIHPIARPAV